MVYGLGCEGRRREDPNAVLAGIGPPSSDLDHQCQQTRQSSSTRREDVRIRHAQDTSGVVCLLGIHPSMVPSLSSDHVLATINQEWRRRQQSPETTTNAAGYLAKQERSCTTSNPRLGPATWEGWQTSARSKCQRILRRAPGLWTLNRQVLQTQARKQAAVATAQTETEPSKTAQLAQVEDVPESGVSDGDGMVANFFATVEPAAFVSTSDKHTIVIDSGATDTFIKDECLLSNVVALATPISVTVGDKRALQATKKGDFILAGVRFSNSLLVPDMAHNLLAVRKQAQDGSSKWEFTNKKCTLVKDGKALLSGHLENGLYVIHHARKVRGQVPSAQVVTTDSNLLSWHRRLGHLNLRDVWKMGRAGLLDGKWEESFVPEQCDNCIMGKSTRLPSYPSEVRALQPGQTVHLDLWGPAPVKSRGGNRYFLTCYDDHSRRKIIFLLKTKSEATKRIIEYIRLVENQLGTTVKHVRSDLGGEFKSGELDTYLKSRGIEHHYTPPTAHAQNGRVERAHLTIANDVGLSSWTANWEMNSGQMRPLMPCTPATESLVQTKRSHQRNYGILVHPEWIISSHSESKSFIATTVSRTSFDRGISRVDC